jgi:hypothetical protein
MAKALIIIIVNVAQEIVGYVYSQCSTRGYMANVSYNCFGRNRK